MDSVSQLRSWNGLGYRSRIYAGRSLVVYVKATARKRKIASAASPSPLGTLHTVQAGESLWSIAREFGVTIERLAAWNGLARNAKIIVGKKLVINKDTVPPKKRIRKRVLYEVRQGDTITGIAAAFKLRANDVLRWNNLKSETLINPGNLITLWLQAD